MLGLLGLSPDYDVMIAHARVLDYVWNFNAWTFVIKEIEDREILANTDMRFSNSNV